MPTTVFLFFESGYEPLNSENELIKRGYKKDKTAIRSSLCCRQSNLRNGSQKLVRASHRFVVGQIIAEDLFRSRIQIKGLKDGWQTYTHCF